MAESSSVFAIPANNTTTNTDYKGNDGDNGDNGGSGNSGNSGVNGTREEFNTYRLDWLASDTEWTINGIFVGSKTYGVPVGPAVVALNMWGDGGEWSGEMGVNGSARVDVGWVEMVWNGSDGAGGSGAGNGKGGGRECCVVGVGDGVALADVPAAGSGNGSGGGNGSGRREGGRWRVCMIWGWMLWLVVL